MLTIFLVFPNRLSWEQDSNMSTGSDNTMNGTPVRKFCMLIFLKDCFNLVLVDISIFHVLCKNDFCL